MVRWIVAIADDREERRRSGLASFEFDAVLAGWVAAILSHVSKSSWFGGPCYGRSDA